MSSLASERPLESQLHMLHYSVPARLFTRFAILFFATLCLPSKLFAVVTSDDYGTHITTPGEPMFGIDHAGVVSGAT
ncbi:MAG: hypothetical protein AAGB46_08540 [Verrucomicrobiota bacterium]